MLDAVRDHFTLAPGAEVTTEANPESTSPELFAQLRAAGFTRVSLGMQSAAPHVLATLDRVHSPGRAPAAAREALAAGFEHVSIDLIYGTPGESDDDLRRSVDAAIEAGVDHVSAYALVVEDGTALARTGAPRRDSRARRRRAGPSLRAGSTRGCRRPASTGTRSPTGAGPAASAGTTSGYWDGGEWWGAGPGAHGYVGSTRWWNVKHPNAYAQVLADGRLPVADFEELDADATHTEDVMLRVRLRHGLPVRRAERSERDRAQTAVDDGLLRVECRPAGAHRPRPAAGRRRRSHRARLTIRAVDSGRCAWPRRGRRSSRRDDLESNTKEHCGACDFE